MKIEGKTVLVTGASGFVGGRLAERLLLSKRQIRVRGLVHNSSNAARLARLPADIALGDMTSFDQMKKIMRGCDIVVHCALGESYYATVRGTENVLRAASEIGIKRFIHISSFAVFGYSPVTEANGSKRIAYDHKGDSYCDSKIDSEKIAFYYYDTKNLPLVVLRPTNVFGPYSKPYTIRPLDMLKGKCYVLIDGGNSPSNAVYIDNVIEAIELAIVEDSAIGEVLLISDDRPVTWREFFSSYARMFSPSLPLLNLASGDIAIERARQRGAIFRRALSNPTKIVRNGLSFFRESTFLNSVASKPSMGPVRNQLVRALPQAIKAKAVETVSENHAGSSARYAKVPNGNFIKIFTSRVQFSIKDAKEILGYKPVVSFEKGMELTEEWLKFQRLL